MRKGGFDYREFAKMADGVKAIAKNHDKFVEDFLLQMALRALVKIKKRTPVKDGDLRNAWRLSAVWRRGDEVMINIINPMLYASFVEYGHWQEVGRYVPAIGKTLVNPWVDGYFMMTISVQEIERQMPQRFEAAWKQYAERLLKG